MMAPLSVPLDFVIAHRICKKYKAAYIILPFA